MSFVAVRRTTGSTSAPPIASGLQVQVEGPPGRRVHYYIVFVLASFHSGTSTTPFYVGASDTGTFNSLGIFYSLHKITIPSIPLALLVVLEEVVLDGAAGSEYNSSNCCLHQNQAIGIVLFCATSRY